MKKSESELYYAKIMLFGEYSVIFNSMALTIPYTHYSAELSFINNDKYTDYNFANESNQQLKIYSDFLKSLSAKHDESLQFDFSMLEEDIKKGMYLESSIPQSYGLGSSGALVAAIYSRYAANPVTPAQSITEGKIDKLKDIFSEMESFFHGTSSGLDPLNCYIHYPLLISGKNHIETVGIPGNGKNGNGGIFLINTHKPSKTGPYVEMFLEKCKQPLYKNMITKEYIPLNNKCIREIIKGDQKEFFHSLGELVQLQYQHFHEMIPDGYDDIWKVGIDSKQFHLKLCGSGGGGFILGFTQDYTATRDLLKNHNIEIIPVYLNSQFNKQQPN